MNSIQLLKSIKFLNDYDIQHSISPTSEFNIYNAKITIVIIENVVTCKIWCYNRLNRGRHQPYYGSLLTSLHYKHSFDNFDVFMESHLYNILKSTCTINARVPASMIYCGATIRCGVFLNMSNARIVQFHDKYDIDQIINDLAPSSICGILKFTNCGARSINVKTKYVNSLSFTSCCINEIKNLPEVARELQFNTSLTGKEVKKTLLKQIFSGSDGKVKPTCNVRIQDLHFKTIIDMKLGDYKLSITPPGRNGEKLKR